MKKIIILSAVALTGIIYALKAQITTPIPPRPVNSINHPTTAQLQAALLDLGFTNAPATNIVRMVYLPNGKLIVVYHQ